MHLAVASAVQLALYFVQPDVLAPGPWARMWVAGGGHRMGWDEPHAVEDVVQAAVAKGSDYRFVNVVGARVSLVLDQSTGRVVVTRGNGAVKIGYLAGRHSRRIAAALKAGYQYEGAIADISAGPGGKYLSLRLDRPVRGDDL